MVSSSDILDFNSDFFASYNISSFYYFLNCSFRSSLKCIYGGLLDVIKKLLSVFSASVFTIFTKTFVIFLTIEKIHNNLQIFLYNICRYISKYVSRLIYNLHRFLLFYASVNNYSNVYYIFLLKSFRNLISKAYFNI